ncbi:unnamed protein product [Blepharisma stoltei]|uniref:protein disulfide-isomerase n=1 Tax=Blepharisma stoltei TaxID=1481888 RepID=A0AAU9IJ51_9CILI|nr:unnamed protein product [Blepharisma stoltei]
MEFLLFLFSVTLGLAKFSHIGAADLEEFIYQKSGKGRFISFCSSSLHPCMVFQDQFSKIASKLPDQEFALVDIMNEEGAQIAANYQLEGYPHIIIYPANAEKYIIYTGSFEPAEIEATFMRMTENIPIFENFADFNSSLSTKCSTDGIVLGVFPKRSPKFKLFMEIANASKHFLPFAYTFSEEIAKILNINDGIVVARPPMLVLNEEERYFYIKNIENIDKVADTIFDNFFGKLSWLNPNTEPILTKKADTIVCLYAEISPRTNPSGTRYVISRFSRAISNFNQKFTYAVAKRNDYTWLLDEIKVFKNNKHLLMIDDMKNMYILNESEMVKNGSLQVEKITEFIQKYIDGTLEPFVLSEEIPDKEVEKGVYKYVGKNIYEKLENAKKDIALFVYSLDCEDCEKVLPMFEKLAELNSEIIFAKIEGTLNRLPEGLQPDSIPAIFYISHNDKANPLIFEYDEDISFSELHKFIKNNRNQKSDL